MKCSFWGDEKCPRGDCRSWTMLKNEHFITTIPAGTIEDALKTILAMSQAFTFNTAGERQRARARARWGMFCTPVSPIVDGCFHSSGFVSICFSKCFDALTRKETELLSRARFPCKHAADFCSFRSRRRVAGPGLGRERPRPGFLSEVPA